ncbi:MAG: hypothetical protein NTV06_07990, partial [candidate division Zixibacteria bacterium]|nr:hypothetical protein [candidate division Zixibacteria bacterium]
SNCNFMGKYYAQMATHPFAFDPSNRVPHRILTSLISYLLGFRGKLVIITNLIFATILIHVIYLYFRTNASRPGDAFWAAGTITFSLVTLTTIHYGGYNDSLTYLIIFLMWQFRSRKFLFYLLFFLGLLNRESIAFLVPWFTYLSISETAEKRRRIVDTIIGLGVSFGLYFLFRHWITWHDSIQYSMQYYLEPLWRNPLAWLRQSYSHIGLGYFTVFKALWIFPIAAVISLWKMKKWDQIISIGLITAGSFAQLLFAYDSSRMLTLGFMVIIISLLHLFRENPFQFRRWIGAIFLFNLMVPQLYTAAKITDIMHSLPGYLIEYLLR